MKSRQLQKEESTVVDGKVCSCIYHSPYTAAVQESNNCGAFLMCTCEVAEGISPHFLPRFGNTTLSSFSEFTTTGQMLRKGWFSRVTDDCSPPGVLTDAHLLKSPTTRAPAYCAPSHCWVPAPAEAEKIIPDSRLSSLCCSIVRPLLLILH